MRQRACILYLYFSSICAFCDDVHAFNLVTAWVQRRCKTWGDGVCNRVAERLESFSTRAPLYSDRGALDSVTARAQRRCSIRREYICSCSTTQYSETWNKGQPSFTTIEKINVPWISIPTLCVRWFALSDSPPRLWTVRASTERYINQARKPGQFCKRRIVSLLLRWRGNRNGRKQVVKRWVV